MSNFPDKNKIMKDLQHIIIIAIADHIEKNNKKELNKEEIDKIINQTLEQYLNKI